MVLSAIKATDPETLFVQRAGYRSARAREIFGGTAAEEGHGLCAISILWRTSLSGRVVRARSVGRPALCRTDIEPPRDIEVQMLAVLRSAPVPEGHRGGAIEGIVGTDAATGRSRRSAPSSAWIASVPASIVFFGTRNTTSGVSMASAALVSSSRSIGEHVARELRPQGNLDLCCVRNVTQKTGARSQCTIPGLADQ